MAKKISVRIWGLLLCLLSSSPARAAGENGGVPPLDLLAGLLTAILAQSCFFLAWKIYSFLKKGELALPWQMLGLSFFLFGLAQLLEIATGSGWLPLSSLSVTFVRLIALVFLAFGLHRTAKILG